MTDSADTLTNFFTYGLTMPAFEGASQDYRNAQRAAFTADPDFIAMQEYGILQGRSRHLARNDPIAHAAENKFITKMGAVTVKWHTKEGEEHPLMQELWDEFYADPCIDGKGNGNTLQATWNHERMQSGEAISRLMVVTKNNSNRVKLKIQSIESEYLDIYYRGFDLPTPDLQYRTRYGITFDEYCKPEIYHFYQDGTFALGVNPNSTDQFKRVQIAANDIIHIFERLRCNQWRGIPIIAPMLSTLYQMSDLEFATVNKQQAAAAISWIVEQADALSLNPAGSVKTADKRYVGDTEKKLIFTTTGGAVQYTKPGDKFNLVQSADIGNNLLGLLKHLLQKVAVAYGIPYYMLSGDTDGLSFAAIRGILIEFRDRLEYIHHFVNIPDGLDKVTKRFKDIAKLSFPVDDAFPVYGFPRYYGVDELKDTQGDILEVQAGFATSEQKREERNTSFEQVKQSRIKDKELGIQGLMDLPTTKAPVSASDKKQADAHNSSN
jgi:lambda family phage portal protein